MSEVRWVEKSGRSVEEALEAALDELGARRDEVEVEVLDEPNRGLLGFLGGKMAKIRVTLRRLPATPEGAEPGEGGSVGTKAGAEAPQQVPDGEALRRVAEAKLARAREFLREVTRRMGAAGHVETRRVEPDLYALNLVSQEAGLVIGRRGQTLDALQYLVNMVANRAVEGPWVRFVLDAGEYRRRREGILRSMALRAARQVRQNGRSVALEPMNPLERRVVHLALRDDPAVMTRSEGEEPQRRVVILPRRATEEAGPPEKPIGEGRRSPRNAKGRRQG